MDIVGYILNCNTFIWMERNEKEGIGGVRGGINAFFALYFSNEKKFWGFCLAVTPSLFSLGGKTWIPVKRGWKDLEIES